MSEEPHASAQPVQPPSSRRSPDDLKIADVLPQILVLFAVLFVAAFTFWMAGRMRNRRDASSDGGISLTNFREMYDAGEITKEEYEKIRLKMAGKMKADLGLSPPPPVPPKSE